MKKRTKSQKTTKGTRKTTTRKRATVTSASKKRARPKSGQRGKSTVRAGGSEASFEHAEQVLMKCWKRLLARKGVTGVDVGYRLRNGQPTRQAAIRIHVEEKLDSNQLHPRRQFETAIDGVPVDVLVRAPYQSLTKRTSGTRFRTPQGGVDIRSEHKPAAQGTLGMLVHKTDAQGNPVPYYLTNAHVVLGGFKKSELPANSKILQATASGKTRVIGHAVKRWLFLTSFVDCALVKPVDDQASLPGVIDIDPLPTKIRRLTRRDVRREVQVRKYGAATKRRTGIVDSVSNAFHTGGGSFLSQIGIRPERGAPPFSDFGDSGSVVVAGDHVVGLLHGVTNSGEIAIACQMEEVVEQLEFTLPQDGE